MSLIFNYLPNWREKRPYVLFQELEQFVCSLDRYDDRFVEETFAEYAIERLEVCIVGVTRLTDMFLPTHLRVLFTS